MRGAFGLGRHHQARRARAGGVGDGGHGRQSSPRATARAAARPSAPHNTCGSSRQSSSALWVVRSERSIAKRRHSASRLFGSPGNRVRARASVSTMRAAASAGRPSRANSALRKAKSNAALCATSGPSPKKSSSSSAIAAKRGLPISRSSVMPCTRAASSGTSRSGWIRRWNVCPVGRSFISSSAATSMMRWPVAGSRPVVSVSNRTERVIGRKCRMKRCSVRHA